MIVSKNAKKILANMVKVHGSDIKVESIYNTIETIKSGTFKSQVWTDVSISIVSSGSYNRAMAIIRLAPMINMPVYNDSIYYIESKDLEQLIETNPLVKLIL